MFGLFKKKSQINEFERKLITDYSIALCKSFGLTSENALSKVLSMVNECKEEIKEIYNRSPETNGSYIGWELLGIPKKTSKHISKYLEEEDVQPPDIMLFWNRPLLVIQMEKKQQDFFIDISEEILHELNGMTKEEAYKFYSKRNIIYGDLHLLHTDPSNRPIPWELKLRINNSGVFPFSKERENEVLEFQTCNAWIRNLISKGEIPPL